MKTQNIIQLLGAAMLLFASCSKDSISGDSIFVDSKVELNELDAYIKKNFTDPYNIGLLYKYVDTESDMNYNLSPANYESSIRLTRLFKYLGLEPYDELMGNTNFLRGYFPKMLNFIGSSAYNNNGTRVLGTAEGGRKITMYNVNGLTETTGQNPVFLNNEYFHTMHHEFAHILHQNKDYPRTFLTISGTDYIQDSWSTEYRTKLPQTDGFVSAYASKEANEDFVETYSFYITMTAAQWEAMSASGGAAGKAKIDAKMNIVRNYMLTTWKLDVDKLREIIIRRQEKLPEFDQLNIK
ncbi:zinc-binding metallopeptidase [Sphingobacterium lactis]|uniref:Substrate import-associated zinc metallohydrolase lipoprotein n=1 Tax=Sphingobacterium lactis TaxID=797291 RepID=A0A1H5ZIF4_9SPHI|nr:putative zinc-binding metallopeptidase [Sphingobacterium lactis]SEG36021.1 substrate import-associated zinc metallohydrolase lipoprotein [Sphingobacterium lactis]